MAENKNNLNIPKEKFAFVNQGERLHDKKFDDKPIGYLKDAWIRFRKSKASVVAAIIILCIIVYAVAAPFVIEQIFAIPGVGQLYMQSITLLDYDVFMADTVFYVLIGLLAGIVVDISYGFIDPRIRMGEK